MKILEDFLLKLMWGKKWLLFCSYNSNKNKVLSHLHVFSKALDNLSKNIIIPSYWVISTLNQNEKTCQTSS